MIPTPNVDTVYKDDSPIPPLFAFEFEEHPPVIVSENTQNRFSEFDGKKFSAWLTNEDFAELHSEVDGSDTDVFDDFTVDEVYKQNGGAYYFDGEETRVIPDEMIEAIEEYVDSNF